MPKPTKQNSINVEVSRNALIKSITRKRDQEIKEHARRTALYEKQMVAYRRAITSALKAALKEPDPASLPYTAHYDGKFSVNVRVGSRRPNKPQGPSQKLDQLLKILSLGTQTSMLISYDDYAAYIA